MNFYEMAYAAAEATVTAAGHDACQCEHCSEIDALSARAEALPPGALRDALEELACLIDDSPGPGAPKSVHDHHGRMVADARADIARYEGVARFSADLRACFPLPRGMR